MKYMIAVSTLFLSFAANAAGVHECGNLNRIDNLVQNPVWATDDIRVAYVSTEEPAAAPDHLLIFPATEEFGSDCFAVSDNAQGHGFGSLDLDHAKFTKLADNGLLIELRTTRHTDDEKNVSETIKIKVTRKPLNKVEVVK